MKIRMLAIAVALLVGAGFSRANITNYNIWNYDTSVMTCSYGFQTNGPGDYQLSIDGTHNLWDVGRIGGNIFTDTELDPTLTLDNSIDNDTGVTWNDYHVKVTMNKSFSFSNVAVTNGGWTFNTVAPTNNGVVWIGYINYFAGNLVPNGGTLDFSYAISFIGSVSFQEELMPSTVPEPGTFVLAICGLTGLLITRRRFNYG
jgi:hypothetical protein